MCRDSTIRTKDRLMNSQLFNTVFQDLVPYAEVVDIRGWGESLILPDIEEKIRLISDVGSKVRVVTNLSFKRDNVLRALAETNSILDISLDATNPQLLSVLRTGSNINTITNNIRSLVDYYCDHSNLSVMITVQRGNVEHLPELIEDISSLGIRNIRLSSVTAEADSPISLVGIEPLIDEALSIASKIALKKGVKLTASNRLGSMPENGKEISPCIHPWYYCYVSYDGSVSFCDHLIGPGNKEYIVGNLYDSTFAQIWNGTAMQDMRQEHLGLRRESAHQFSHCSWCYKNKYVDFEERFVSQESERKKEVWTHNYPT